jgi:hypothetical protein
MSVKTWTFGDNTSPTDQSTALQQSRSFYLQLVTFLTANGWTVAQSCDSTQVSNSNLWASLSNLVWASSGAHSWIVLKSPEGIVAGANFSYTGDQSRIWLCLECGLTVNNYQGYFYWHRVAPTGGTTSAAPTSTSQLCLSVQQFLRTSFSSSGLFHFRCCSTGEFIAMAGYTGSGFIPTAFGILPITGVGTKVSAGTPYPYAAVPFFSFYNTTPGALATAQLNSGSFAAGWNEDGSAIAFGSMNLTVNAQGSYGMGYSFPSSGDSFTGKHYSQSVYAINTTSSKTAYVGKIADIEASGQSTPQGAVDSAGSPASTFIGNLWLPANTVLTL